jgi:hypothetical protein
VDDRDRGPLLAGAEARQPAPMGPVGLDRLPELPERRLGAIVNLGDLERQVLPPVSST